MVTFHALYKKYSLDVFRYAYWLSGSREDAEDITSETFVRAWAGADCIRLGTVKAYLLTIARNLFFQLRKNRIPCSELDQRLRDSTPGPEEQVIQRNRLDNVFAILKTMPEIDRSILFMRFKEGMSFKEIAICLNLSLSAVKVRAHRARLVLTSRSQEDD